MTTYVDNVFITLNVIFYNVLTEDKVSDNCVIVLLNDKYLNTLIQATKTLNADKIVNVLAAFANGEKSACKNGFCNNACNNPDIFNMLYRFNPI